MIEQMFDIAAFFESFVDDVKRGPVAPHIAYGDTLRTLGERYTFEQPQPLTDVIHAVRRILLHASRPLSTSAHAGVVWLRANLLATHPAYFGLFNPHVTLASVAVDAIAAAANPQVGGW